MSNQAERKNQERAKVVHKTLKSPSYVEVGSAKERELLAKFEADVANANEDFVDYVKNNADIRAKADRVRKMTDTMNQYYNRQMMMACYAPLIKGINRDTMVESLGMYLGMYVFSKNFRENIQFKKQSRMIENVSAKLEKHPDNISLRAKRNELLKDRYGMEPMSPQAAAGMKIGFAKQAYEKMREPGADVAVVKAEYDAALQVLDEQCLANGVSIKDRDQSERVMVYQLSKKDPTLAYIYKEVQQGVRPSETRKETEVAYDENGNRKINYYERWNGEFQNKDGEPFTAGFTPRMPGSRRDYEDTFSDFMYDEVAGCETAYDLKRFLTKVPGDDAHNKRVDARFEKIQRWQYETGPYMKADGFNDRDIHFTQAMGLADAVFRRDAELKDVDFADLFKDKEAYYRARDAWVNQNDKGGIFEVRRNVEDEFTQRQEDRAKRGESLWDEIHREQSQSYRKTPWDEVFDKTEPEVDKEFEV